MNCRENGRKISALIDGELEGEKARNMETHLLRCAVCRQEWESLKQADTLIAGLSEEKVSADFARKLRHKSAHLPEALPYVSGLARFLNSFFDTIFILKKKNAGTLDEFGDFPPCSLSRVYFNLL